METDYKWYCRHCGKGHVLSEDEMHGLLSAGKTDDLTDSVKSLHEKVDILVANKTPMQHRVAALEKNSKALEIVKEIMEVVVSSGNVNLMNRLEDVKTALKGR